MTNQERWIEAMCRITCSLISDDGIKLEQALLVCKEFSRHPPAKPTIKKVKALEFEAEQKPPIPEYIRVALDEEDEQILEAAPSLLSVPQPISKTSIKPTIQPEPKQIHRETRVKIENYPEPWCKVIKGGKVIRYEDNKGNTIPEIFWPK